MAESAFLDGAPALPASDEAATAVADAPPCPGAVVRPAVPLVDPRVLAAPAGVAVRSAMAPVALRTASCRPASCRPAAFPLACVAAAVPAVLSAPWASE